jgi:sulfopyruvate decarboxylase TPP-binding subunit
MTANVAPVTMLCDAPVAVAECLIREGVARAVGVADSQLADVVAEIARSIPIDYAMREDVAVAMAVGASLAGGRAAVFMKNAGLGTSLDAIVSLAIGAGVPALLVIGWAGSGRDQLPHHVVMGVRTAALLDAAGIEYDVVRRDGANDVARLCARLRASRSRGRTHALLVEP